MSCPRLPAALTLLLGTTLASVGARAAEEATAAPASAAASPAEVQAAAAQKAAQDAEAQVAELRRQLGELERARASTEDLRRRFEQLEARQAEAQREAEAARDEQQPETSVIRFKDDGLEIRSPDNSFYLRPLLRVQAIYTGQIASQGPADPAVPDASGFSLGRAEVILEGHVGGPFFRYRLQLDAAQPNPLQDAYVVWQPHRAVALEAGQFKVPYSLQRQYWRAELEFVDLSPATIAFSLERDLGAMVVGQPLPGRLTIQAAILNGAGANLANDNLDLAYALRIVATPFGAMPVTEGDIEGHLRPRLSVSASGSYNLVPTDIRARTGDAAAATDLDGDGRIDNVAVWQGNVALRAIWRGASLQAEWFGRLEDLGVAGPSRSYWGGYVQGGYFLLPHRLQLAARVSHTDLPLYGATLAQRQLAGSYQNEQAGVLSAYIHGHRVKAQVEFSHLTSDGDSAPRAERVRAALQIGF